MKGFSSAASQLIMAVVAAAIGIGLFWYSDYSNKNYFTDNLEINRHLQSLQTDFYAIESEILRCGSFLYYNYDVLRKLIRSSRSHLQELRRSGNLHAQIHSDSYLGFLSLDAKFKEFQNTLENYLTLNASLKNSVVYIPNLQLRSYHIFDPSVPRERDTLMLLSKIGNTILLTKNTFDSDFLKNLNRYTDELAKEITKYEGAKKLLLNTLRSHLAHFEKVFPQYTGVFNNLLRYPLPDMTAEIQRKYQEEAHKELTEINNTSQLLLVLYLISLGIIIYYIFNTQKENRRLHGLRKELERLLVTDALSGLENRLAFQRMKRQIPNPALILVNINRFTHINNFYGTLIGDAVLKSTAEKLREITPDSMNAHHYRLGGDDFGILFEMRKGDKEFERMVSECHRILESDAIYIKDLKIDVSYRLGGSREKNRLFETADMALKYARKSSRRSYAVYTPQIDTRKEIAKNIRTIHEIRKSLSENRLLPYYQPIYDVKNGQISKYEALARIELPELNRIMEPENFIGVAKEAKLSGKITLSILEKTLRIAQEHPFVFSVNLSADDIEGEEDRRRIYSLLEEYRHTVGRIVFEILESEEIRDYKVINDFINTVKRCGCRIAIDDFGSGYSNFEKILKMDIDMLKIDGSLIQKIDHDRHSELIVKTILDFAKYAGFETVAEYVHSKSIFEKVEELGFNYAQGYFIGKPSHRLENFHEEVSTGEK